MHRLRLLYALESALSADLASSAQSTANFGFSPPLKTIVSFGGAIAWLPAFFCSRTIPLLSKGNNSGLAIRVLRAHIGPATFGKAKSEFMSDDSLIGSAPSSAPAPSSPIP
jgi:hypothetical protein